ncbi:MAG: CHAP domain-containing protein [Leptolyngbyaceae cyanobacterium SL_5_9]|nr:CHAP domain-containing protein [Leptolyngbyaceae cyanobacterium SL_5_9]NJO75362.1 CHAP domain-containing protein [Leptolyngbyaceae cyanobacterium RM1_406_9]
MNSPWVKLVQIRLNEVGCGPLVEDGDFGENTDSAVRLFQARSVDRNGEPLVIDGEIGSLTWEALFGQATVPGMDEISVESKLFKTAIEVARSQIGVKEVPLRSNRGPEVDQYLRSVGLDPGYAWCAAFIYWCFDKAANKLEVDNPLIKTAGCLDHWNRVGREGIRRISAGNAIADPSLIQPGLIFIMDYGCGNGHTGIVEAVNGGKIVTIEGNTNDQSEREGHGVFKRTRKINGINKGFIDYRNA